MAAITPKRGDSGPSVRRASNAALSRAPLGLADHHPRRRGHPIDNHEDDSLDIQHDGPAATARAPIQPHTNVHAGKGRRLDECDAPAPYRCCAARWRRRGCPGACRRSPEPGFAACGRCRSADPRPEMSGRRVPPGRARTPLGLDAQAPGTSHRSITTFDGVGRPHEGQPRPSYPGLRR